MNDFYDVAERNDKLVVMSEANRNVELSIKSAFGKTERKSLKEIEMQGSVMGPIKASVQIDSIGKDCIEKNVNLFKYKNLVDVPPLSFIDDILAFSKCGQPSVKLNCFLNGKIQSKRLWFSDTKCHHIHAGRDSPFCPPLIVHGKEMEKVESDKYLGDIISSDSSNQKDIDKKLSKGMGIISQIMALLNDVSLGAHYFEIALLLRESLFVNGLLTNWEVKYGLKETDLDNLEKLDKILLRKILNAHSKVPIESLYLETGVVPLKIVVKSRRIMYLHHILSRKNNSLIKQFFQAQNNFPVKNDWSETVQKDLEDLNINMTLNDIKAMSKIKFKKYLKIKTRRFAFKELLKLKETHSKMDKIIYKKLEIEPYLKSTKIYPEKAKLLYKLRTHMADVKSNFSRYYFYNLICPLCENTEDTQVHLLTCEKIHKTQLNSNNYEAIFSRNIKDQISILNSLEEALMKRKTILESY